MAYTTIDKPTDYFNTKTYTGTATSSGETQAITGVGFQPDWVWIKNRDGAYQHVLYDAVRGVNKEVRSSQNIAEVDSGTNGYLSAFDSDGFTTTRGTNTGNHVNANGSGFVSWNWLGANGTASNTDGSITSTVSANTTAGFSIVSYTGTGANATVGHGLGADVAMLIIKKRSSGGTARNWSVWHKALGGDNLLSLNTTSATASNSIYWGGGNHTTSVFEVNTSTTNNENTYDFVAYCFAEKKAFSRFGSYVGNGSSDGSFIWTGFKPAFVIIKQSSGSGTSWNIWDNKRLGYNTKNYQLEANTSVVENTSLERLLITSNGFKCLTDNAQINGSGNTYIYMAFAENPFVTSTGIPTTAR